MNQFNLVKQLAINALFWVGIVAIVLSLLAGSLYFLVFFAGLILFNFVIVNLLSKAQPEALNDIPSISQNAQNTVRPNVVASNGVLGFRLTPVAYPKVMDNELRDFAPEFISVNIEQNGVAMFSGSFARDALKQFRDGINQVLNVKSVPSVLPVKVNEQVPVEPVVKSSDVETIKVTHGEHTIHMPVKKKAVKKSKK